jgi:LuxR family maltose regulon positive regulatory protein
MALESALALAAPAGFVRLFLDAGEPIGALLTQRASRPAQDDPLRAFIEHLLAAFNDQRPTTKDQRPIHEYAPSSFVEGRSSLDEPLSERELEVLRLMAAGLSNQEIADRLIISVPTVKKHGSNIFGKLHATNRTEAVAHARDRGLLP